MEKVNISLPQKPIQKQDEAKAAESGNVFVRLHELPSNSTSYDLHINHLENRLGANFSLNTATHLALRYWQAACFATPDTDQRTLMQRANHIALTAHRRNPSNIELYCLATFISIESGHYDLANDMLDKAMGYKAFLRASEPHWYAVLCFLYAYLEIGQKRVRSAKKHWRALTDYAKQVKDNNMYAIMQGMLHLASEEFGDAYGYFREVFRAGSNSIFMYAGLYRYYSLTPHKPEGVAILAVLTYAAARGVDIRPLAEQHQNALLNSIRHNPAGGEYLYKISNYPPILQEICAIRIQQGDTSLEAYKFYKEAEHKQVLVSNLFEILVKAAYKNGDNSVNHYALSQFFRAENGAFLSQKQPIIDEGLAIYVYHQLLASPQLTSLLAECQSKILEFTSLCLSKNISGRETNSLYYYFWSHAHTLGITGTDIDKAEAILQENLTKFELSASNSPSIRYIYITEAEKRGMMVYNMQDAVDGKIIIDASSQNIAYTCLGVGQRAILSDKIIILPMIQGADVELFLHFFNKGDRRFHLLAYLTNHYLNLETPPDSAIPIFQAMLAEKTAANSYKMRILVVLGRLHYNAFSFEQALECYGQVNEKELGNDFIPQVLSVYMQTNELERAIKLLEAKHMYVSTELLLDTVITLIAKPIDHTPLAGVAYNLLISGNFRQGLLDLVLTHLQASYTEWVTLAKIMEEHLLGNESLKEIEYAPNGYLTNEEVQTDRTKELEHCSRMGLDMRIVQICIDMANWDKYAQIAFVRVYNAGDSPLTQQFIEYATFELLSNDAQPEHELLNVLEQVCLQSKEPLLTWGLANCYLHHNITTKNSDQILSFALQTFEDEGILLPIFKQSRPSRVPFIEKYQPFLHRGMPGKDYRLNYRIDDASVFISMPMQYLKYGMYVACLPLFYNEEVTYYFSEEMATGSIETQTETVKNTTPFLYDHPTDPFFAINNALTYDQMFKHEQVEKLVDSLVKEVKVVRSKLL